MTLPELRQQLKELERAEDRIKRARHLINLTGGGIDTLLVLLLISLTIAALGTWLIGIVLQETISSESHLMPSEPRTAVITYNTYQYLNVSQNASDWLCVGNSTQRRCFKNK